MSSFFRLLQIFSISLLKLATCAPGAYQFFCSNGGSSSENDWVATGTGSVNFDSHTAECSVGSTPCIHLQGKTPSMTLTNSIDATDYHSLYIQFDLDLESYNIDNDYLHVETSQNGGSNYGNIVTYIRTDTQSIYQNTIVNFPNEADGHNDLKIRFVAQATSENDDAFIDNICVYGIPYTSSPTSQPTNSPTNPTTDPTTDPTMDPTNDPTKDPTYDPTTDPTNDPTYDPTIGPTYDPTTDPTLDPTIDPTNNPTVHPTTTQPTKQDERNIGSTTTIMSITKINDKSSNDNVISNLFSNEYVVILTSIIGILILIICCIVLLMCTKYKQRVRRKRTSEIAQCIKLDLTNASSGTDIMNEDNNNIASTITSFDNDIDKIQLVNYAISDDNINVICNLDENENIDTMYDVNTLTTTGGGYDNNTLNSQKDLNLKAEGIKASSLLLHNTNETNDSDDELYDENNTVQTPDSTTKM